MPTFRPDLASIPHYVPGRPIDEVAREHGIESIDKLASNECPEAPFAEVVDAIARAANEVNRYPDSSTYDLSRAIAEHQGLQPDEVWVGAGSSEVLRNAALSVGGPGTSAVFAHPSFVMYRIATMVAWAEPIAVPLTAAYAHDLSAMADAVRDDTTVVYVCNPNNPTGNHIPGEDVMAFIDAVPERVLVVVDEAYAEYVTADDYQTFINEAPNRPNLLVARTFSKIYGLAGVRVGYGVGAPELLARLRQTQPPFTVTSTGQIGAIEALKHPDLVAERSERNETGRSVLTAGLAALGFDPSESEANFVYFEPPGNAAELGEALLHKGLIVRVLGAGIRVTVGTEQENRRFLSAIEGVTTR
ncbi:MAG: histidinol-phosphate transaminase [Actinomycetota bacterium]